MVEQKSEKQEYKVLGQVIQYHEILEITWEEEIRKKIDYMENEEKKRRGKI